MTSPVKGSAGGEVTVTLLVRQAADLIEQGDLQGAERILGRATRIQQGQRPPIELLGVEQLFAALEPIPWVCRSLEIAPGAPTLVAGYGYSGKTLICQDLLLSVATGRRLWGSYDVAVGSAVHLDYEMGSRLLRERYQRLALDSGLGQDDIGDRIRWACFPRLYLDSKGAEDHLSTILEGTTVCLFDSLKASAPGLDENSADARRLLDMLTRVSERTGCAFVVIHHSRKPSRDALGGARMAIRGSGALYDACQSVLVLEGEKGEPVVMHHEKARLSGSPLDDIALRITDTTIPGEPRDGLRITIEDPEQLERQATDTRHEELAERVLGYIRSHPGCSTREVQSCGGRKGDLGAAMDRLEREGAIRDLGSGSRRSWRAVSHSPQEQD